MRDAVPPVDVSVVGVTAVNTTKHTVHEHLAHALVWLLADFLGLLTKRIQKKLRHLAFWPVT